MRDRARDVLIASLIPALVTMVIYLVPVGGTDIEGNPNELVRIQMTEAMIVDRSVSLDGPISAYGVSQDQSRREGRAYSDKAPGLSFFCVPAAWILGRFLPLEEGTPYPSYWPLRHALVDTVVAVPAVLVMFALARLAGSSLSKERLAWLAALLCVATPMMTYATTLFSHVPAALLVGAAYALTMGRVPSIARAGLAGLMAGLAVTTEYPVVLLGGVLVAGLLLRRPFTPWPAAACAIGMAAGVAPALAYHAIAFGSPFTTGYAFKMDPGHAQVIASGASGVSFPTWERFHGVMLSARRGLLFYCPMLALALPGLVARWRRAPADAALVAGGSCTYLLFGASFVDWQGGWCAAARHLLPIVPILCIAIVWGLEALDDRPWFAVSLAALAGVSAAHQALSLAVTPLFPELFDAPLAQMAARSLLDGAAMPNIVTQLAGISPRAVVACWGALVLVMTWAAVRRISGQAGGRRRWSIAAIAVSAALCAAGLQAAWSSRIGPEQERARAIVLDRLGHHELAQRILRGR